MSGGYYGLSAQERAQKNAEIHEAVAAALDGETDAALCFCQDGDTYIRKAAYQAIGKLYALRGEAVLAFVERLYASGQEKIRQTAVYACGEIARANFDVVEHILQDGLRDVSASVRNAVTGALKTAGEKSDAALAFCEKNILCEEPEVRRLLCHGMELRGRKRPQDILPALKKLQFEQNRRVRDMLVHVLGQISYKKGCFAQVAKEVAGWENAAIYEAFKAEAIEVHGRYEKFSEFSRAQVEEYFDRESDIK